MSGERCWTTEGRAALVTGGAGFIGSHVAEALHALGWHVEVLDNLSTGNRANVPPGVTLHVGDVRCAATLARVLRRRRFYGLIHGAAQTSVARSMGDPRLDWEVNVLGTRLAAAAAQAAGVSRFVFISSGGAIYGETAEPATEETLPAPRSYYGLHKYAAEAEVRASGLSWAVLRPANVYGPRQRAGADGGVVATFRERLLAGKPLEIYGDGTQVRDFLHVSDMVRAVLAALRTPYDVTWNVASGEAVSIAALAALMAELAGRAPDVRYLPPRPGDVRRSLLSPVRLLATGLWGPPVPMTTGLLDLLRPAALPAAP